MIIELEKARKLKAKIRRGEVCLGAQIAFSDSAVAEILGRAGYDWLVVDMEHTSSSASVVRAMLQAAAHTNSVLLTRPLHLDPDEIRRLLDLGSPGVLCPFINNGHEARTLVAACRYPPSGTRGYGPRRAAMYGFDTAEYMRNWEESMICIPIIESKTAVENIEAIVSVEGIDGVCIGPMDLSISLGVFGEFEHPTYQAAYSKVREACTKFGKGMGTAAYSLQHAKDCVGAGVQILLAGGDDDHLVADATHWIETLRHNGKPTLGGKN